ncbi:MAG TPA: PhoH family protein [Egibacteraceae bacterium]|nr:PhoH family protein [Egibacteraceae bacterium]
MPTTTTVKTSIPDHHAMVNVLGTGDELLKLVEQAFDVDILVRGNDITVTGDPAVGEKVVHLFDEFVKLLDRGQGLDESNVTATIAMVQRAEHPSPSEVLSDEALTHRGRSIRPKTLGQKHYLDAIRKNTVVFGIGPAGTGKTYLAMAMAVLALKRKEVNRIILTRPAVEAGERLGFLPGTLFEKIDPYLRPLFDALYDMMDAEQIQILMERGTIEVAPLAFMRGRAQPLTSQVATPEGFRSIGSLRVGDLVIGSDGRPTPVLGVYPQGRRQVYRLRTQDGASTLACAEHLWAVYTPEDRRRGKPARVLQTREMLGNLRRHHQRRYELPLVTAPVRFQPCDVPMDPYALGLLLGDGCLTGSTTPSFATTDPELVDALEEAIDGIVIRHKGGPDYTLNRPEGRGGLRAPNRVTQTMVELGLAGTNSKTKFIPDQYLHNSPEVRLGVLQGLLDTDGGPVTQRGRTCRIQYTTVSDRLRDDVVFLVRSLGGVAYWRTRAAAGRKPGLAHGRPVHHRSDAFIMDIHLPAGIEPFRLQRKAALYAEQGGGRPMRMIESIEPAGEADTVCIQVAAADSLYVTDDFLVTHNTLNSSFIVLDEAQNTTPEQMKMFLTRLGFGSKAVVTGDVTQVDLPSGRHSGLTVVRNILTEIDGVAFCELGARDVVRHRIVQEIVEAYAAYDDEVQPQRPAK